MGSGTSKTKPSSSASPPTSSSATPSTRQPTGPAASTAGSPQQTSGSAKASSGSPQEASSAESSAVSPQAQTPSTASSGTATDKVTSGSGQQSVQPASSPPSSAASDPASKQEEGGGNAASSIAPPSSTDHAVSGPEISTAKDKGSGDKTSTKENKNSQVAPAMAEENERILASVPEHQARFDSVLRGTNALVKPDSVVTAANDKVDKLSLNRALPDQISLGTLVTRLKNLQVLDVSGNQLGPQGIRTLCLALPPSSSLTSLCVSDNKGDTDTAESIGHLLSHGPPLVYLDVSGNYLGKDFFSRSAGQALKANTSLQTLRAQSIGMVDIAVLMQGLQENRTLVELDLSSNHLADRGKALSSAMAEVLKRSDCCLQSLAVSGCNIGNEGLKTLSSSVAANSSLRELNVSNNEFGSLQTLLELIGTVSTHPSLINLHANDARITDKTVTDVTLSAPDCQSQLQVLSVNSSHVTDEFFSRLAAACKNKLLNLLDVDMSNGASLTAASVKSLWTITADADGKSSLRKLTTAMNDMDGLPALLTDAMFPNLSYLNLRRARLSADGFSALPGIVSPAGLVPLATLVLDGLKLSGRAGLSALFENCTASHITALSLSGCSLTDTDLSPLIKTLGSGFKAQMVKLSDNRLTDSTLTSLAESLLKCDKHPLSVLDVSGNQITEKGVDALCAVYTDKKHASSLHSLNLNNNSIGKDGVLRLVSCMGGKFPLKCLYVNNQSASYLEANVEEIYIKVASVLGYTVKRSGETIEKGCSALPALPESLFINMRGLGGHSGELGPFLDCPAIRTDASAQQHRPLTLDNVLELCASLQGRQDGKCVLTTDDWNHITGAKRDNSIPSWLQLADGRTKGVYFSNLPGNATTQRLEALFEMEADCNIDEVFLVKDPVTKNNSGTAWVLFSDEASVERALEFYRSGQAQVFGTAFTVSRIQITIEDAVTSGASDKAKEDLVARQRARAAEDRAHRQLIQQNTEESWKRHAYRLAHPAYADGRIW